ncbi:class I SAM-dependent rRNA methyltransferase [Schleiferia thermophila]
MAKSTSIHYPKIIIRKEKEKIFFQRHPWIFSGAIGYMPEDIEPGSPVVICNSDGAVKGIGFFGKGSIAIRVLTFTYTHQPVEDIVNERIREAIQFRRQLGFFHSDQTNCFRLIFAEVDALPGLIVDYYAGVCVMQCHHPGMYKLRTTIYHALMEHLDGHILGIFDKSADALHDSTVSNKWIYGTERDELVVSENGNCFHIDIRHGQKTGFFIDQRENRKLLSQLCKGKSVLNTFCYTGGFSIYALKAGAEEVVSVDSSSRAIEILEKNIKINGLNGSRHQSLVADAFDYLTRIDRTFDIIVLDPPAFAKSHKVTHNAITGYKRLNALAMKKIPVGGLIMTFSCSQNISDELFYNTVVSAAMEVGIDFQVIQWLDQPADHPVSIFHPEGKYLKGILIRRMA